MNADELLEYIKSFEDSVLYGKDYVIEWDSTSKGSYYITLEYYPTKESFTFFYRNDKFSWMEFGTRDENLEVVELFFQALQNASPEEF